MKASEGRSGGEGGSAGDDGEERGFAEHDEADGGGWGGGRLRGGETRHLSHPPPSLRKKHYENEGTIT